MKIRLNRALQFSLLVSVGRVLSAALYHALPLYQTQRIWCGLCKRSFHPGCQVPPYILSSFLSLGKNSSQNQTGAWLFRVIQVKNLTSCSPLQFLLPKPGAQAEMRRGREQHHCISYATFTQMARRNL